MTEELKPKNGELQTPERCNPKKRPDWMGSPSLLEGENPKAYQDLFDSLVRDAKPADSIDMMSVCNAVTCAWKAIRIQRLSAIFYKILAPESVAKLRSRLPACSAAHPFMRFLADPNVDDLARRWAAKEEKAVQEVQATLKAAGLTDEAIDAQTLMSNIEMFERFDRTSAANVDNCTRYLREIERRRAVTRKRPAEDVEEAEYEMVAANVDQKREKHDESFPGRSQST